jgi:hypothetical protein
MEGMIADDVTRRILARYEAGEVIVACGWCRRVDFDGDWHLAPSAAMAAVDQFTFTHGICPPCYARAFPEPAA